MGAQEASGEGRGLELRTSRRGASVASLKSLLAWDKGLEGPCVFGLKLRGLGQAGET